MERHIPRISISWINVSVQHATEQRAWDMHMHRTSHAHVMLMYEQHIMYLAGWSATGEFMHDFAKNATKLGITPHPHVRAERRVMGKDEQETEQTEQTEPETARATPNGSISPATPATLAPSPTAKKSKRERDAEAIRIIALTGWVCDRGTAAALAVTIPACKTLQTIK